MPKQIEESESYPAKTRGPPSEFGKVKEFSLSYILNHKIIINSSTLVKPGFFSFKYDAYNINCSIESTLKEAFVVERKYSDFIFLNGILKQLYPGYMVPLLPKDERSSLEPQVLEERQRRAKLFLGEVLNHPVLKTCEFVKAFLSISDHLVFSDKKQEVKGMKPPEDVSDVITHEGQAKVSYNVGLETYCTNTIASSKKIVEKYVKYDLNANQYRIRSLFTSLSKELTLVSNIFSEISEEYSEISKLYNEIEGKSMSSTNDDLEKIIKTISETIQDINKGLSDNLVVATKYFPYKLNGIIEHLAELQKQKERFYAQEKALIEKKESCFKSKKVATWELSEDCKYQFATLAQDKPLAFSQMLPKETHELKRRQNLYGYCLNKAYEEIQRIMEDDIPKMKKKIYHCMNEIAQTCSKVLYIVLAFFIALYILPKTHGQY